MIQLTTDLHRRVKRLAAQSSLSDGRSERLPLALVCVFNAGWQRVCVFISMCADRAVQGAGGPGV